MTVATYDTERELDWTNIFYVIGMHSFALLAFIPGTFSWKAVGVALLLHWITGGLGVTLGLHRLLSHRSFDVPKWLEYFFAFCATLACQGQLFNWVGLHRLHHKYSDQPTPLDPHNSMKGFWWSHIGWMFFKYPEPELIKRLTQDINEDPFYKFCDTYFVLIQSVLAVLLYLWGSWPFVIWGIFVRLVVVFHCTWFINSGTHQFGYQTYPESNDNSKNCWWIALLTYGEGWHNNHHAYQYSARHGWKWWELDITWMTISLLKSLGLATNVKMAPVIGKE
jgi:stearoyl-CoA desaturase (delta-9 desaturase)